MDIILDTNIFAQDFLLRSKHFELLFDYLQKTSSKIIMPEIVFTELEAIYCKELKKRVDEFHKAKGSLQRLVTDLSIPNYEVNFSQETQKYLDFLLASLWIKREETVPYRGEYLEELVKRAVTRTKPFSERGEEFRDALVWLTILDIAQNNPEKGVVFISNDSKAFGTGKLYDELTAEVQQTQSHLRFLIPFKIFFPHMLSR